ncbi:MAG: LTA synthase family protein [Clostridiaceae bacterium]
MKIKLKNFIKDKIKNNIYLFTVLSMFLKIFIFLALVSTLNATSVNVTRVFLSVPPIFLYLSFIVIFLSFGLLFKNKNKTVFYILNILYTLYLLISIWYFRKYGNFISANNLLHPTEVNRLYLGILAYIRPIDLLFIVDLFIIPIRKFNNISLLENKKNGLILFFMSIFISSTILFSYHYIFDVLGNGKPRRVFDITWNPNLTMCDLSPLGYLFYDSYYYLIEAKNIELSQEDKNSIETFYDNKEDLPNNAYFGKFQGKNLIIIQVESLENFVINQKINNQEITPNINKLLNNSIYFPNYYDQVNGGTSSDCYLLTNTSLYPIQEGSTFFNYPNTTYNSLPLILKNYGYTSEAMHADKGGDWNFVNVFHNMGYDSILDQHSFIQDEIIYLGLSDGSFLSQSADNIANLEKPFYSYSITLTSHGPFNIDDAYRELEIPKSIDKTHLGGYFQSINYTDKQIGLYMDKLDKTGLLDDSIVVIYGDHEGVHKYYSKELSSIEPHEDWWMENNKKIPLIIYSKDMQGEEITTIGGQVDLLPTLCYILGIDDDYYKNSAMGRNLLNTNENFAILNNGTYIGDADSEEEITKKQNSLKLADKIIKSDYFK